METRQGHILCLLLTFFHLTYTLSKQLASLYFEISFCYQDIKFPRHLPVTWVQGRNLISNPPVGKFISSLWFGNIYFIQNFNLLDL